MKRTLATCFVLAAMATGCTAPVAEDGAVGAAESASTTTQAIDVANLYNAGVANGFTVSFLSAGDAADASISYGQEAYFWGRGPDGGAAVTYTGAPLGAIPFGKPATYDDAAAHTALIGPYLQARTPFAAYFSLGSAITAAEMQQTFFVHNQFYDRTIAQKNMDAALRNLELATSIARALCRASGDQRGGRPATPFDTTDVESVVAGLRYGVDIFASPGKVAELYTMIHGFRTEWGAVIADPAKLESGTAGAGCGT